MCHLGATNLPVFFSSCLQCHALEDVFLLTVTEIVMEIFFEYSSVFVIFINPLPFHFLTENRVALSELPN